MPILVGSCLLAIPLLLHVAMIVGVHAVPTRSFEDASEHEQRRSRGVPVSLGLLAIGLYTCAPHTRQESFFVVLLLVALLGAAIMRSQLITTYGRILNTHLDPTDWSPPAPPGPRWRYEMKTSFVDDPEYVDDLLHTLISTCTTYDDLVATIHQGRYPDKYDDVLDRRYWGRIFPTVRQLTERVVLDEVIRNDGRHNPGKAPRDVFIELRALAQGDKLTFMDRWQYYWCLRNLNVVSGIVQRVFGGAAQLAVVAAVTASGIVAAILGPGLTFDAVLRSELAGALVWLVVACGGASFLLVALFRGTGTFAISYPSRGVHYDPLWTAITRLGIAAFTISFVIYGIGSPFVLAPDVLAHFKLDAGFVAFSGLSLAFCLLVFLNHLIGTHMLMVGSRENALTRLERKLAQPMPDHERATCLERFKEARNFGVWPIRGSTIAGLIVGIAFPIAVQVILIYSGLN